jgi:endonuclease YncB( thermonuclease family)
VLSRLAAILAVTLVLSVARVSAAEERIAGPVEATLLRVIDGDTVEVRAHLWLGLEMTTRVRLSDVDAPELDGACPVERDLAELARVFLASQLGQAVVLQDIRRDKYGGRVVARVLNQYGQDVARLLLAERLALPATARPGWCR